jgi:hypothetical protein
MNAIGWPLLELTSRLLDREDREVVLGDLLETNENAWRGLLDVFGLVFRRQAGLWRDPRPWLAGFALALHVSAAGQSQGVRRSLADGSRGFSPTAVPHLPAHRLVLVSWLHGWNGFATDPLGECCSVCSSLLVFPLHTFLRALLLIVPSACNLGRPRGMATRSHLISRSLCFGAHHDCADDLRVDQRSFVGC